MKKVVLCILLLCTYIAAISQNPILRKDVYPEVTGTGLQQATKTSNYHFFNAEDAATTDRGLFRTEDNDVAYSFTPIALDNWGVVGSATPNGWGGGPDIPLIYDANSNTWSAVVSLTNGEIKFRNNNDWSVNYGDNGADGSLDAGGSNIVVTAGNYLITLNFTTLNYSLKTPFISIPDPYFEQALIDLGFDKDGVINASISTSDAESITQLDVTGKNISSLQGMEAFINLSRLFCQNNQIQTLDISKNTALTVLECGGNQLTELNVTKNLLLRTLGFGYNNISAIDVTKNLNLEVFWCNNNKIVSQNLNLNPALTVVGLSNNPLSFVSLKNGNNIKIVYFEANNTPKLGCINADPVVSVSMTNSGKTFSDNCAKTYYVNDDLPTGDIFTAAIGNNTNAGTKASPFGTLTYALSQSAEGDTIYVDAGTYVEQVTINNGVTIIGAGQNLTSILKPSTTVAPPGLFFEHGVIQTAQSITGDVHISNLSITGGLNPGVTPIIIQTGGSVKNCKLQNGNQGIFVRIDPSINLATKTFLVDGNIIDAEFIAVNFAGTGLTATLTNNNIAAFNPGFSSAVFAVDFGTLAGLTVTGNTFSSYVSDGMLLNTNNGTISQNSFLGTGQKAINKIGGSTINATCNWYGSPLAATVMSKITAGVTYSPWLSNGTDNSTTVGFQTSATCPVSNSFYVNDNTTTGDVFTTAVGNNANPGTFSAPYGSLNYAIAQVPVGATIYVDAGLYAEDIVISKSVVIIGAKAGVNPGNLLSRGDESVLVPATNDPVNGVMINILSSDVTIDGLTIDGDNPLITGTVTLNGVDINKGQGITRFIDNSVAHNNIVIKNNIVKNLYRYGVFMQSTNALPLIGNLVTQNHFDNIPALSVDGNGGRQGRAVGLANNAYASVTQNVFTRVHTAVWLNAFNATLQNSFDITGNTIESYRIGIIPGGFSGSAAHYNISSNNISTADLSQWNVPGTNSTNFNTGIFVNTASSTAGMNIANNTIANAYEGLVLGRLSAPAAWVVSGNTISGSTEIGLYYFSSIATNASIHFENNILSNNDTGIYIHYLGSGGPMPVTFANNTVTGGFVGLQFDGNQVSLPGNVLGGISFTSQSLNYIQLTRKALNYQSIDASSLIFEGKTPAQMTLAELFAAENKIAHRIDYDSVGFVKLRPAKAFLTVNSFNSSLTTGWGTATTAADLQRAIAAVATNDTIHVDAGTYTPGNFTIDKSITILGSNYLITPNNPSDKLLYNSSRNAESIISNSIITFGADNINIEGLQFNTPTSNQFTLSSTAVTNDLCKNLKVSKNRFVSTTTASNLFAFFGKAGTLITGGYLIDDNRIEEGAGASMRLSNLTDVTITNNSFIRSTVPVQGGLVAIRPQGPITNLIAENNTIQNWDLTLIQAAPIKNLVYNNNNLISCQRCILLNSVATEPGTLSITNNIITQHSTASAPVISVVRSTALNAVSPNLITIDNNSITKIAGAQTFTLFPLIDLICNNSAGTGDPLSSNFQVSIKGNKLTYGGNMSSATTPNPHGLQFSGKMAITTIENNEIIFTGTNLLLPAPNSPLRPTGIFINNSGSILPGAAINILNNKIQGFKHSVAFFNSTSSSHGGLVNGVITTISNNSFTGDELSVNNGTSGQAVNATCNWYGVNSAQDVSNKITPSTVNAISWLTNGTDNDIATGFQPVPSSCDGSLPLITLNSSTNVTCNGASNGSINITATAGKAPFTYTWTKEGDVNFVSNDEDPTGLAPGVYHLAIVDANGSNIYVIDPQTSTPGTVVVTITEPTVLTAAISNTSTACSNIATVTAGGGTTGYTYLWSNGSTATTISGVPLGTYTVTVTDTNGCTVTSSVTLTVSEAFNPSASVINVTCFGANDGVITVTNINGTAPFMYSKDGGINFENGSLPFSFTNLAPGNYTIAVKDANGCVGFVERTVVQPTPLVATISNVQNTCFGTNTGAITMLVSGGVTAYSYSWTKVGGGFSSSQLNISGLAAGNYILTVTDKNNCTYSKEVLVPTNAEILVNESINNVTCRGAANGSIAVNASSGGNTNFSYLWNTGANTPSIGNLAPGNYSVRVTDNTNSCFVNKSFTITQPALALSLTAAKTNATGCNSLGTITAVGSGGTLPYTYTVNGAAINGNSIDGLYAGDYTVTVTDANGCTTSKIVAITDNGGDEYEGNNSKNQAKPIPVGTTISARLALSNDAADWFTFTAPGSTSGLYSLKTMHPDLNVVYTVSVFASGKNTAAIVPVSIISSGEHHYQLTAGATYFVSITTTTLSYKCYSFAVSALEPIEGANRTQNNIAAAPSVEILKAFTYPNPHNGNFTLSIESPEEGVATVELFTVTGQKLSEQKANVVKGKGNTVKYSNMNYAILFYKVSIGKHIATGKIISPN